jgi:hypothetical protein
LKPSAKNLEALRRDRGVLARLIVDLWAIGAGLLSRKFLIIEDHMIWNYRGQLEAIAEARRHPSGAAQTGS